MTKIRDYLLKRGLVWRWIAPKIIAAQNLITGQAKKIRELERREQGVKEAEEKLLPLVEKLTNVVFCRERDIGRYRLMLTFDTHFVDQCFVWGGSQWEIEHYSDIVAERVKYEVLRELKTLNFARYRDIR